jgi:Spy/CpxP family protein refolding chaperone
VLTSPEDLAAAVARAKEFERRNAEIMELRAQRHEAVLARLTWRGEEVEVPTLASA